MYLTIIAMKFDEFVLHYPITTISDVGVAYWNITSPAHINKEVPTIEDHTILLVISGTLRISVQGEKYSLYRGCLADVVGGDQNLKLLSGSHDIHAICILLKEEYIHNLFKDRPPFPPSYIFEIRNRPVYIIEERELPYFIRCLDDIGCTLENKQHHYQAAMLMYRVMILFVEAANLYLNKKEKSELSSEIGSSRKNGLFLNFVKLLSLHIHSEHTVEFYASTMCVTPQYLRRVVKECSGKTVSQWINEELLREISKLLSETTMSVQEISDKLNFSDMSVMSKFFSRHKGVSPLKFRNEQNK